MHAELLAAMAGKGADLVAAHRFTPETLAELHYPLDRARAYASEAARRSGADRPPSLTAFERLLEAYGEFCAVADEARRAPAAGAEAVRAAAERVRERAAETHRALVAEGRLALRS
ncbi:MAG TPA: hypothetical protein VNO26_15265 [Candidatus Limnocylindria bacterium]|nr:hypothetical protein [Candidatus Limnocylindria bacterium]